MSVATGHVPRMSRQLCVRPEALPLKTHADAASPPASVYEHHEHDESSRHRSHVPDLIAHEPAESVQLLHASGHARLSTAFRAARGSSASSRPSHVGLVQKQRLLTEHHMKPHRAHSWHSLVVPLESRRLQPLSMKGGGGGGGGDEGGGGGSDTKPPPVAPELTGGLVEGGASGSADGELGGGGCSGPGGAGGGDLGGRLGGGGASGG